MLRGGFLLEVSSLQSQLIVGAARLSHSPLLTRELLSHGIVGRSLKGELFLMSSGTARDLRLKT